LNVQDREPAGQTGFGAAFLASFFAVKERREPNYEEILKAMDRLNQHMPLL